MTIRESHAPAERATQQSSRQLTAAGGWLSRLLDDRTIALVTAGAIFVSLVLQYFAHRPLIAHWPVIAALVYGGIPLLADLIRKALKREFGSDLLAGMSILTAAILGQYLVAAIVVLMLSGGAALEEYATRRASSVLDALARRVPQVAHREAEKGVEDIRLDAVEPEDRLLVFPHEICPVDGIVVEGHGTMDESFLTGEPYLMAKAPGSEVISGSINGEAALTIVASRRAVDSRYARIMAVMRQTEEQRPAIRRVGDRLGAWYTPAALLVAALGWILSGDSTRFLAVLVIATPCPLLISIPVAVIGAISLSARRGIIIKNPPALEKIDLCRTLIFDKTGTLTYGKPAVTTIHTAGSLSESEALRLAVGLETYSKHPLAIAIVDEARKRGIDPPPVEMISEKPGDGLRGLIDGQSIRITGRQKLPPGEIEKLPPLESGLECLLFIEDAFAALFRFHDAPRQDSGSFIRHLGPQHAVDRVMLVSGDRESEVRYLAASVGVTEIRAGQSPEQKVAIVREEVGKALTLFVGDGINDAPAMQAATVGVAFGQHSDITAEAADAVVLESSLVKVDELIHIGRRMRKIALQSAVGGMALSMIGMLLAACGYLPPIAGAISQEFIDLIAVLNAVRVAFPPEELTDF